MRTMFVLRGAPGAGKTTAIARHGLAPLALSLDAFRHLFSTPFADLDGQPTLSLAHGLDKKVVVAFREALAARLRLGGTVLIDATNPARRSWREFAVAAQDHGYRVYVINVQDGLSDAELLARNEERAGSISYVDPAVVTEIAARVRAGDGSVVEPVVDFADVRTLNTVTEVNVEDRYDRVVFIGDVQSCSGALAKLKEHFGGWDPRTLFIFVGDLFDRGPDAAGVAELIGVRPPDNVVLVEGNHDENLRFLLAGLSRAGFPDTRVSLEQLRAVGYTKKDLADLVERFVPAYALRFAGRSFLVTHAGLAPATIDAIMHVDDQGRRAYDLTHLPLRQLLLGSSSRQQTYRGFSQYDRSVEAALSHPQIVQVHGHRNGTRTESPGPEAAAPNVWALEQRVEHGGHLAALEVNADGQTQVLRFREERTTPALDPNSLLAHMAAHPEVIVRPVEGLSGVVSCNFTRRAFATKKWDDVSCKARGLFLDRESRVVARGYDKFFNVGEALAPRDLDDVVTRGLGRPLTVRRKWNGYLALVAVVAGELRVFSKAGVTPYSRHAAEMLQAHLGERVAELAARLAQAEVTLTFEVISDRDPHLVDEGVNQLVLLDAIANQETFTLRPAVRAEVERDFAFVSPPVEVISEAADDAARLALAARAAACEAEGAEGLVITYGDGQLTKYKSAVYTRRKAFRSLVERHLAGRKVEPRGAGAELFARFLARDDLSDFWVDGLRGPTLNIPALVASL